MRWAHLTINNYEIIMFYLFTCLNSSLILFHLFGTAKSKQKPQLLAHTALLPCWAKNPALAFNRTLVLFSPCLSFLIFVNKVFLVVFKLSRFPTQLEIHTTTFECGFKLGSNPGSIFSVVACSCFGLWRSKSQLMKR